MQPTDFEKSRKLEIDKLQGYARILDSAYVLPGTRFRWGLDAVFGLLPGIGDGLGAFCATALLYKAARLGIPLPSLYRMVGNILVDTIVGSVPVFGDFFDIVWRANEKNLRVIRAVPPESWRKPRSARKIAWMFALLFLGFIVLSLTLFILVLKGILSIF